MNALTCEGTGCEEYTEERNHLDARGGYGEDLDYSGTPLHKVTFNGGAAINFSGDTENGFDYVKFLSVDGIELVKLYGGDVSWSGYAGALIQCF